MRAASTAFLTLTPVIAFALAITQPAVGGEIITLASFNGANGSGPGGWCVTRRATSTARR